MTRIESRKRAIMKMRSANNHKDYAQAIVEHFKLFHQPKEKFQEKIIEELNAPLLQEVSV